MNNSIRTLLLLLLMIQSAAHAQGTAFTYQGELLRSVVPADGLFDFEVALHVSETGGTPIDVLARERVSVDRGRFVLSLDFTEVPFQSGPTWLEIGVRPGSHSVAYTPLSPRQRVGAFAVPVLAFLGD